MPNVELIIKSPSRLEQEQPLRLSVPLEGTVKDIKEALSRSHPEHPLPSEQRLIFAGRLLVDGAQTADVLRQVSVHRNWMAEALLPRNPGLASPLFSPGASAPPSLTPACLVRPAHLFPPPPPSPPPRERSTT